MTIQDVLQLYTEDSRSKKLQHYIRDHVSGSIHLKNLFGSSPAFVVGAMLLPEEESDEDGKEVYRAQLFLLPTHEEAAFFLNDLENLYPDKNVVFFPSSFKKDSAAENIESARVQSRTEALIRIRRSKGKIMVVTYPEAVSERVVTKSRLEQNVIDLKTGEVHGIVNVVDFLSSFRFERSDFARKPGQFAVRGGIVDIFSFANELPYRISFAGDVIESIRLFDPVSQLSETNLASLTIMPNVQEEAGGERESLFDFFPGKKVVWIKDGATCMDGVAAFHESLSTILKMEEDEIESNLVDVNNFLGRSALEAILKNCIALEFGTRFLFETQDSISFGITPQPSFNKNFSLLSKNLSENSSKRIKSFVFADSAKQAERIYAIFEDLTVRKQIVLSQPGSTLFTPLLLALHEGFIDEELKLACYTDHQIFNRYHRYKLKNSYTASNAITVKELNELRPGDFVTHIDHGIGKYGGLEKIDVNGRQQEAIRLVYRDNDILYISIHSLHRIAKYSGKEGDVPSVHKLGTAAWTNLKNKTKKRVKDIARELILLYAKRKSEVGFAFTPDSYLQTELEASFIYEDTPDQITATADVKKDMESVNPMDRLVCGDVGFGKTEIAIRAAFKCATEGKQVAILVPTTILALQHFNTFSERLKEFPCTVDYINRFKSRKEQKETIKNLAEGKVDILIGTHKILSKEIVFKDLGLLVIDEEQKFGVASKEKIKSMKVNVDTLTLTATPIPRTLQFSMMGARDLSIINTPPPNRFPVTTELHSFNEKIIQEAIRSELHRGGQVFFVHNRVQNIHEISGMIERLVPEATVAVGHGQMDGAHLEEIMLGFVKGEFDVLVSTTIIESGLDIPNANTIIINAAQNFGLSDLHQMRGRVGRSNKKAFCYLLAPPPTVLTAQARQRLKAIEEFSDLGSGINIAMRDLDIRGAGNLLGGEQSGFITELGFETYHKILDEAIRELKQSDFKGLFKETKPLDFLDDCVIESDLEILIPDQYVENITERLKLYKELDEVENEEKLIEFQKNIEDRFGKIPRQVSDLLNTVRMRRIARLLGIEKVVLKNGKCVNYLVSNPNSHFYKSDLFLKIMRFVQQSRLAKIKEEKQKLSITFFNISNVNDAIKILTAIRDYTEAAETV